MGKIIALLLFVCLALSGISLLTHGCTEDPQQPPEITVETVVAKLQPLQELATMKVGVSGIVTATQPGQHFWMGESRLVVLVRGEALYSIDLAHMEVEIEDQLVTITLPQPRVSEAWVDVERSEVWERDVGRFAGELKELEARAWASGLELITAGAESEGHREAAMAVAEKLIGDVAGELGLGLSITWIPGSGYRVELASR